MYISKDLQNKLILKSNGWDIEEPTKDYVAMTATKGKNNLYLHPQNYSGVCENSEREQLFKVFQDTKLIKCRTVDTYDEVFDMSDEELYNKLNNESQEIESNILIGLITKRSNLYISNVFDSALQRVIKKHCVKRLAIEGNREFNGMDVTTEYKVENFVKDIFYKLVSDGKIASANTKNGIGYRTVKTKK